MDSGYRLHWVTIYNTFNTVYLFIFTDLIENPEHYLSNLMIMKTLIYLRLSVGTAGTISESIVSSF